jgi:PAS domain S-box-containing protein
MLFNKMKFPFSEALFETILEASNSFLGVYDVHLKEYVYLNNVGLIMLEIPDIHQYKLKYPAGFRVEINIDEKLNEIANYLKKNSQFTEEALFKKWTGEEFWGSLHVSAFEQDNTTFYFVRINDITTQKQNEQHLQDEESRFEALFMHSAIGIIMVNREGEIVLSNRFADSLFGYASGELNGKPLEILIPKNLKESHYKTFENFTHKPQARPMGIGLDLNGRRKNDTLFPIEISLSHFMSGGTPYYISFINDVTFKKKTEIDLINKKNEIEKLNESLEREVVNRTNALVETLKNLEIKKSELEIALSKEKELGELKSRFVSMASHEFRTPLTAIQSAASLIEKYQNTDDQEKRERNTSRIKAAVGNLTDILEEFLSVGKLEEGKIEAKRQRIDLPALIHECQVDVHSLIKKGQNIIYNHIGKNDVNLDKSLFRKIVINLCSNALKFSPEGSDINIITENKGKLLILKIADKGIGISKEDQKHLFDRFFRGTNVTNIQGTGLGLHIVARYTELLQGKVEVESEINLGTTFKITVNI